jgi:hypothetical protein
MQVFFEPDDDRFMAHRTSRGTVFGVPDTSATEVLYGIVNAAGVPKLGSEHLNRPYLYAESICVIGQSFDTARIEVHYEFAHPIGHA